MFRIREEISGRIRRCIWSWDIGSPAEERRSMRLTSKRYSSSPGVLSTDKSAGQTTDTCMNGLGLTIAIDARAQLQRISDCDDMLDGREERRQNVCLQDLSCFFDDQHLRREASQHRGKLGGTCLSAISELPTHLLSSNQAAGSS